MKGQNEEPKYVYVLANCNHRSQYEAALTRHYVLPFYWDHSYYKPSQLRSAYTHFTVEVPEMFAPNFTRWGCCKQQTCL